MTRRRVLGAETGLALAGARSAPDAPIRVTGGPVAGTPGTVLGRAMNNRVVERG